MAGVADKARHYLEQSVPQLRDFEAKNIFTSAEIPSLVKKRTDFEHKVLSPGNKPSDWLAYAKWEMGLEALRAKRCRRLQIRTSPSHVGQGRVFGILERAVSRHPGSPELWTAYLRFAHETKATKRWRKIMSRALRMHPAKPELWVIAGRRSAQNGDMQAARAFFMRGSRFCTRDATVWLEYAKCEMEWLGRMEARKGQKGGVTRAIKEQAEHDDDQILFSEDDSEADVDENGRLLLPDPDSSSRLSAVDSDAMKELENNPALDGAIPLAIFDIARKQGFFNVRVAEDFFTLFSAFPKLSSQSKMLQHVLDVMTDSFPGTPSTCLCIIKRPLIGIDEDSPAFPGALRQSLANLKSAMASTTNKASLGQKASDWVRSMLAFEELDPGIRSVLEHTILTLPGS